MSAATVPTVVRREDGAYAVPVNDKLSLVWRLWKDGDQPVLTVKVEEVGAKLYVTTIGDAVTMPIDP